MYISIQLDLECTGTTIKNSTTKLPLPTDYYCRHNKQFYKTATGSQVSIVVAAIVMQNIKEQALATYKWTIPLWLRYVDDTFTAVCKLGKIDDFHKHHRGKW